VPGVRRPLPALFVRAALICWPPKDGWGTATLIDARPVAWAARCVICHAPRYQPVTNKQSPRRCAGTRSDWRRPGGTTTRPVETPYWSPGCSG
jgi:hypothetical protein